MMNEHIISHDDLIDPKVFKVEQSNMKLVYQMETLNKTHEN